MARKYLILCIFSSWFVGGLSLGYASEAEFNRSVAGRNSIDPPGAVKAVKAQTVKGNKALHSHATANPSFDEFLELDEQAELLVKEVLNLNSDIAILEEEENNPAKYQLLVLVTMDPTDLFKLDFVELKIDNQTVAAYNYTTSDLRALLIGGAHRLYLSNLPAGLHKLSALMAGRVPRDPDYKKDLEYDFISGVARTVVELSVSGKRSNGFPTLIVKEQN